jgi:hypothetical protein
MTETGDADLTITTAKIVGEYATDFEVISPATPFTIVNGESDEIMILTCTPSDLGVRTATLKLSTNDPTFSEVEYTLKCTGIKENTNDSSVSPTPSAPVSPSEDNIKERASNNFVNFKTRPARLKQNLAGQEQRPNLILTWQVFF